MSSQVFNTTALGVVEITYYANALGILDQMLKAADVKLVGWEKKLGGCLVTIIVGGSLSDVQAAIDVVKRIEDLEQASNVKIAVVIAKPHPQITKLLPLSSNVKNKTKPRRKKDESIRTY